MRIELAGVARTFPSPIGALHALRPVDLCIEPGEHLSVTGPSGAGKSTLLNLLGGLDPGYGGRLLIDGEDAGSLTPDARAQLFRERTAFIFQRYHLLPDLTVLENLMLPLDYRDVPRAEARERAEDLLSRFSLMDRAAFMPDQLSGGEQQLLAVLRAAVTGPELILADEPTGALHSAQGAAVLDLLEALNADGTTVVMATHSEAAAARARRRYRITDGWLERER